PERGGGTSGRATDLAALARIRRCRDPPTDAAGRLCDERAGLSDSPADVHAHGRSGPGVRRRLEQAGDGVLPDGQLARLGRGYPADFGAGATLFRRVVRPGPDLPGAGP